MVDVREEEEVSYCRHRRYVFAAVLAVIVTVLALLFTSWLRDTVRVAAVLDGVRRRQNAGCRRSELINIYGVPTRLERRSFVYHAET